MASQAACRSRKIYEWPYSCSAVTADALKIITAPSRHSASVTINSQRSFSSRLGIALLRIHGIPVRTKLFALFQMANQLLKHATPMFVVLKLVKARASWRQQDDVTGMRRVERHVHRLFQCARTLDRYAAFDLLCNFVGRCANQQRENRP